MSNLNNNLGLSTVLDTVISAFARVQQGSPFSLNNMKQIPLTRGLFALVSDEDFERVSQRKWFARKSGSKFYAATWQGNWRSRTMLHLHHLIAGTPKEGNVIDHIDRNGLNCQRNNLRECTGKQNSSNRTGWGKSKYLGVSISNQTNGEVFWRAFININGKQVYLGQFTTAELAAEAYDKKALETKGGFASLNFPNKPLVEVFKPITLC
jgi:hypothetical protein